MSTEKSRSDEPSDEDLSSSTPEKYNGKREWDDKHVLYELYWGDNFHSIREVGRRLDVPYYTIRRALEDHGIPRRERRNAVREEYIKQYRDGVETDEDTEVDWTTFD